MAFIATLKKQMCTRFGDSSDLLSRFECIIERSNINYKIFIGKLTRHSIYRYIVDNGINHSINKETILSFLKSDLEITNKTKLIDCEISNNKHKKLRRYLTTFKIKKNGKATKRSIYIRKVKLGYITMNSIHREFVEYVVANDIDKIYYDDIIKIIDFISSVYNHQKVSKKELKLFIKGVILEADSIYNKKECEKPQVIEMADISNHIYDLLKPYITLYNRGTKTLDRFPHLQYYKNSSDYGYYYPDRLKALEWDYACSLNWGVGDDFTLQFNRINKTTKLNTLISIYKGLIDVKLYNPRWCRCVVDRNNDSIDRIKLKELIDKYSNSNTYDTSIIYEIENLNIAIIDFVRYCQTYYSENMVFQLIAIL